MEWYIFELYNWLGFLFKDIRVLIMFFIFVLFLVCLNFMKLFYKFVWISIIVSKLIYNV